MNDIAKSTSSTVSHDYRWVLRYSALAFWLLTAQQIYAVSSQVPTIKTLLNNFGAELPAVTIWAMENHMVGSILVAVLSSGSAAYVLVKASSPSSRLKGAYLLSVASVVMAFAWSGWITSALLEPIFRLGASL